MSGQKESIHMEKTKKVLITKPKYSKYSPTGCKLLRDRGYEIAEIPFDRDYTLTELIAAAGDADAVIADSEPWCEESMSAAPNLKIIARYGTGMNTVDVEAAERHGIICTNCPGINANAVAEHAVALMLCALRDLTNLNETTKQGLWRQSIFSELAGMTVGIVGFGFIGRLVAKKLTGFDCRTIAYDTRPNLAEAERCGTEFTDLEDLLSRSNVICLHVPLVRELYHLINADTLKKTRPGVVFVSEARGEVVDESAMYDALVTGRAAAFATDVFEHEPATPENTPLLRLKNVIASPHNGGETYENSERCGIMTARQVIDALEGREPENVRRASEKDTLGGA